MKREEVIEYINSLKGYEGYIQFSHRPIDIKKDIFIDKDPIISDERGFVLEAYFFNGQDSISIRQINSGWVVDESKNIILEDIGTYHAIGDLKIKMAQQWRVKSDENCVNMEVMKLEKVVFAGFEKGESHDNSTI